MDAQTTRLLFLVLCVCAKFNSVQGSAIKQDDRNIELYDGVSVQIPENDTRKLLSLEINMNKYEETGRAKNKKLMQKWMPMFILPFVIQSTIVPLFLGLLKFMLFKSLMIGKLALVLIILNAFRNSNSFKGRQDEDIANIHYGYHGNGNEDYYHLGKFATALRRAGDSLSAIVFSYFGSRSSSRRVQRGGMGSPSFRNFF